MELSPAHVDQFFALLAAGLAMVVIGAVTALRPAATTRSRFAVAALVGAAAGGAVAVWSPALVARTVLVFAAVVLPVLLAGSPRAVAAGAAVVRAVRRPAAGGGLLAVAGLVVAVGSVARFHADDAEVVEKAVYEIDPARLFDAPPLAPAPDAGVRTDGGRPVRLKRPTEGRSAGDLERPQAYLLDAKKLRNEVVRRGPAGDETNCHGWVFTGGRFWLPGEEVVAILGENGYTPVTAPRPGDLVVYRGENGEVTHTAVVRYVADGQPVMVEGKWGWMAVFLHPVDKSVYGSSYAYYRSPRAGHLLAGLPAPPGEGAAGGGADEAEFAAEEE